MRSQTFLKWPLIPVALLMMPYRTFGADILQTSGFSSCDGAGSNITVQRMDIEYNNDDKTVTFNVAGTSAASINVTAVLNVLAYGTSVYSNSFNPCDSSTFVQQLCPIPTGSFSASGTQTIPAQYASLVPAIAFQIPDISAQATLQLKALDTGEDAACITSVVSNGKTVSIPAVSYVAASVAGAALVLTGISSTVGMVSSGSGVGSGTTSPGFVEVMGWFQGLAMNGMMSVSYPPVYRAFTKNFAFSTGLIPWTAMQTGIDNFRSMTGGNLTDDNIQFIQNATLTFSDGTTSSNTSSVLQRALAVLESREIATDVNSSTTNASSNSELSQIQTKVFGIGAYVENLSVPQGNSFMTVLLIIAIIIAAISVSILFLKVILEVWALFGSFPKSLKRFRKDYWGIMARSIVQLVLLAYGTLVLFCVYQLVKGDSWAAKLLAAAVLTASTGVLAFFAFRIWELARTLKKMDGDVSQLYDDKETWIKYSLFYESYKKDFWWTFVPAISYLLAKGCVLAAADGHGLVQTIAQLVIEIVMLLLLLFARPYERRSGNIINIFIQVVRALSVVLILVFVEELGIAQTTQTITGVVLIAVQSALTALLAILIAINAVITCFKANPHRKRRKEAERLNRDLDNLTPLHAHNSLLMSGSKSSTLNTFYNQSTSNLTTVSNTPTVYVNSEPKIPLLPLTAEKTSPGVGGGVVKAAMPSISTDPVPAAAPIGAPYTNANSYKNVMRQAAGGNNGAAVYQPYRPVEEGRESLVSHAAPPATGGNGIDREPTLPTLRGYRGW